MSFGGVLRQSTAVDVLIGPFVDSGDGDSEEGGLTIAQADVRLSKNGQTGAQKNDNTTCAHDADGFYNCELDATDTNTVGQLTLYVHVAGALCVRHDYQVIEEAVYDALYAASALGYVANAPVNVAQFGGSNGTFASGRPEVNTSHIAGSAVSTTTAQIGVNAVQISGDSTAADNLETAYDDTAGAVPWLGIIDQGTAQSASGNDIVLRAGASFANDTIIGAQMMVLGSTQGYWQAVTITDYVGATDTATVSGASGYVTPSGTITYKIFATSSSGSGSAPTVEEIADEVETRSLTVGTNNDKTGYSLSASQTFDMTGDITGNLSGSVGSVTGNVGGNVAGSVGSVTGNVGGNVTGSVGSLAAQAKADVNAEVVDTLATDTYAAPGQGAPASTTTLATKIGFLYKAWRNRSTQTASEYALYADDTTTKDQEAVVSDDNTTFDRGEVGTGA